MHIGQAALDAIVVIGELLMIQPEQMECGRVQVVGIGGILTRFETEFVAGAVTGPPPDSAPGHPGGKDAGVVVASFLGSLHKRLTPEL